MKPSRHRLSAIIDTRTQEQIDKDFEADTEKLARWKQEQQERGRKRQQRIDACVFLGLPISISGDNLDAQKTMDILMDKDKLRELVSKLNNKAFW